MRRADSILGSTARPSGSPTSTCDGPPNPSVIAQRTSDSSTPYAAPGAGTLTQWQVILTGTAPGQLVTFVVLRAAGSAFSVDGVDARSVPNPLPSGNIATYTIPSPIAVTGGETLGLYTNGSSLPCYFYGGTTALGNTLMRLSSPVAPAAGQTLVLGSPAISPGGYTMNESATFVPAPSHKKKCKKKKKHRSAESAKKKKCKKKKKP